MAILALAVFTSGCTSQNYYSGNGITFNYPASWKQLTNVSIPNSIAAVGDPKSSDNSTGNVNTNVVIQRTAIPPGTDLKQLYSATNAQYAATLPSFKILSDNTTTVDNTTAYINTHIYDINGVIRQEEAVWLAKNGNVYVILCGAPPGDFAAQQANFNIVINSFKVK